MATGALTTVSRPDAIPGPDWVMRIGLEPSGFLSRGKKYVNTAQMPATTATEPPPSQDMISRFLLFRTKFQKGSSILAPLSIPRADQDCDLPALRPQGLWRPLGGTASAQWRCSAVLWAAGRPSTFPKTVRADVFRLSS